MKSLKFILLNLWRIFLFSLLTALTQIGGLVYLFTLVVFGRNKKWAPWYLGGRWFLAVGMYLVLTFFVVPHVSSRKALPIVESEGIRPVNAITVLLNRNYVDPELYDVLIEAAEQHGSTILYMDACFPFVDGFPLLPHLSHDDGEKVDLAFHYGTGGTDLQNFKTPGIFGYGAFEKAQTGEFDAAEECRATGYWQYSLTGILPTRKTEATFHPAQTKQLIELLCRDKRIGKVFLEPHLKSRLGIGSDKVRFHGCYAVRHDDHIHVQL